MTAVLLQQVVNGVTIGVVYALIAVRLTLVFGILSSERGLLLWWSDPRGVDLA